MEDKHVLCWCWLVLSQKFVDPVLREDVDSILKKNTLKFIIVLRTCRQWWLTFYIQCLRKSWRQKKLVLIYNCTIAVVCYCLRWDRIMKACCIAVNKTAHSSVKFAIMKDHSYYVCGKQCMYDWQVFCWYRSETVFLEILTASLRPLW